MRLLGEEEFFSKLTENIHQNLCYANARELESYIATQWQNPGPAEGGHILFCPLYLNIFRFYW